VELGVFEQIALVLTVCVAAGVLAMLLRQPLIVGLLAAGIAVGPALLGIVEPSVEIELLATVGTSLLLFVVGLKLDVRVLERMGTVGVAAGLGQVVFTAGIGYAIARGLGLAPMDAMYVAMALTFSSTIIIVKLLSDKRELNTLHGRVALAILVVQDLVVVVAMLVITAAGEVGALGDPGMMDRIGGVLLRAALLLGLVVAMGRIVAPRLRSVFEHHAELLVLTVVTWAVLLASFSAQLGFSSEVGAFLAGVSLASTNYRDAVASRLGTLRDFVLVFFFIELGTRVELTAIGDQLGPIILLSLFVLVGNPVVVMSIMGGLGYRRRVSFKSGLTVAQISEFSLILVALGVQQGHIGSEILGMVTVIGVITIAASTELIHNADRLYPWLAGSLAIFERSLPGTLIDPREAAERPEYVVVGVGRLGSQVLEDLLARGDRALGVDFDPRGVKRARWKLPVVYGDAAATDLPERLPLDETRWIIMTVRHLPTDLRLISSLREYGYTGSIAVAADDPEDCRQLQAAGAEVTLRPLHLSAAPLIDAVLGHDAPPGERGSHDG
jgi:Kef-type K+ transport system membrane component KefB